MLAKILLYLFYFTASCTLVHLSASECSKLDLNSSLTSRVPKIHVVVENKSAAWALLSQCAIGISVVPFDGVAHCYANQVN